MARVTGIRTVVAGAAGRMGRTLVRAILEDSAFALVGALEASAHVALGGDAGRLAGLADAEILLSDDTRSVLTAANALIDFTTPTVSVSLASLCAQSGVAHIIGTTGFSAEQESAISAAARASVIVKSGNMSLGVALLAALARRAARALPDFDVEIVDVHHRMKRDAPSGTALLLGHAVAAGRSVPFESHVAPSRTAHAGPREDGSIGFASLRGGTVAGEHQVIFAGPHERVILAHVAEDRMIFARGALAAARWAQTRNAGLYSMTDVLGLTE